MCLLALKNLWRMCNLKCIVIQAIPDVCHAQSQFAIAPEVSHSGNE